MGWLIGLTIYFMINWLLWIIMFSVKDTPEIKDKLAKHGRKIEDLKWHFILLGSAGVVVDIIESLLGLIWRSK